MARKKLHIPTGAVGVLRDWAVEQGEHRAQHAPDWAVALGDWLPILDKDLLLEAQRDVFGAFLPVRDSGSTCFGAYERGNHAQAPDGDGVTFVALTNGYVYCTTDHVIPLGRRADLAYTAKAVAQHAEALKLMLELEIPPALVLTSFRLGRGHRYTPQYDLGGRDFTRLVLSGYLAICREPEAFELPQTCIDGLLTSEAAGIPKIYAMNGEQSAEGIKATRPLLAERTFNLPQALKDLSG